MADEFNQNSYSGNETGSQGASGNGSYQYNTNQGGYHNSYSSGYGSNQGCYGQNSYSGNGNSGNNGGRRPHSGKGGKALLAIVLAAVFGVCTGAGAYGIRRAVGDDTKASVSVKDSRDTDKSDSEASGDSEQTKEAKNDTAQDKDAAAGESASGSATLDVLDAQAVETQVTQVAKDAMPSIVSVYNTYTSTSQDFFGQSYSQQNESTGSGIIISKTDDELLIATNNHVVANEDSLEVQFIDETTAAAQLKGTDSGDDLAVIAVSLDDLDKDTLDAIEVATLGSSDDLVVGEPVVAIGNALGYGQSVTTGVVSALNREMTTEDGQTGTFIQTDAAINPGNSGGALLDLNGNVIGINSSKIGGSAVEGMGYAIPMSKAIPIIEDLMNQDTKTKVAEEDKGYLGISGVSVTSQVSSAYDMPEGVYVAQILENGGAADSELQKGDIITAVNGSTVSDMEDLQNELQYYAAGTEVTLTVERSGEGSEYSEKSIRVTLGDASTIEQSEKEQQSRGSSGQDNGSSGEDSGQDGGDSGNEQGGYYSFPFGNFFGY